MPVAVGVKASEVAVPVSIAPGVRDTAPPTAVPPAVHPEAAARGPQTEKLTVPVGTPTSGSPVTVAESDTESPRIVVTADGVDVVVLAVAATATFGKRTARPPTM